MDIWHGKFNLWQRQTYERGEAAIDGAVAAGETGAARGGIKEGDRVPKLTRAQQRHARRAKARTEANKIEEREE